MTRRQLTKIGGAILVCLTIIGFSIHRGAANVDLEDRKLEAFITAAAAVDNVMASWQPKIVRADGRQAQTLRDQANAEIRDSIEQVDDISLPEYREIRQAIAADPHMLARVIEIMHRMRNR